jgi:transposase
MKTHVGVDLHQRFCYLTAVNASGKLFKQGQVVNEAAALRAWLRPLPGPRQVVVEASGFWPAFARAAAPEAERLVMVHPQRVKAIASAKLKNDRVDSETLAHLSRCDLLPEAWMADEPTQQLRLLVRLRITLGRQRARAKNQLQAVLHQEGFKKPVTDVFGKRGRAWLKELELSAAGRLVVDTWLREVDHLDAELAVQTRELERMARADARARFLQTVPGIGPYAAMVIFHPSDEDLSPGPPVLGRAWRCGTIREQARAGQLCGLDAGGARVGGQAQAGRHYASGIEHAALDHAASSAGGGALFARGAKLLCGIAAEEAGAGGQDRPGAQAIDRGVGDAASWRVF